MKCHRSTEEVEVTKVVAAETEQTEGGPSEVIERTEKTRGERRSENNQRSSNSDVDPEGPRTAK
jgi:hypothetical protein